MKKENWKIWDLDESVEQRTFKRVTGELQEMESTKQLVQLVKEIYSPGMSILDVGCAAGHYYHGLKSIDENLKYYGVDSTVPYIEFAKDYFKDNPNTQFALEDIFKLPEAFVSKFDIVYCCNVILHLPSFQIPFENLIRSSKKYCIIRTLMSEKTHLSKFLYSDTFDENGEPSDFVYQNTYSFNTLEKYIHSLGNYKVEFIDDQFDEKNIVEEYQNFSSKQDAVTNVQNNVQIAGSKVFEWKWLKITK
jgi:SAM-dependent methyltransferase